MQPPPRETRVRRRRRWPMAQPPKPGRGHSSSRSEAASIPPRGARRAAERIVFDIHPQTTEDTSHGQEARS